MGVAEKIQEIEAEMRRTQKNKSTEYHLGLLKGKLARLRTQLLEPTSKPGPKGEGFDVAKSGDARVAFIGFPSVGKSTLLSAITKTRSATANYEFTTLTAIPGVLEYDGAEIQMLDLPGIIEGASQGRGGRQAVSAARTADLILVVLDATKAADQREKIEYELEQVGVRLNKKRPDVTINFKKNGGVKFNHTVPLTHMDYKMAYNILHEYKLHNADILIREDITVDDFIDVVMGNRRYVNCLYCYSKIDAVSLEEVDRLARLPKSVVISCNLNLNLDFLKQRIWEELNLYRVYTKRKGEAPDFSEALIVRKGSNINEVCNRIHRSLAEQLKYALVWGSSAKHSPQLVGLNHLVHEGDVVTIVTK
ncbi:GTP binding protein Gtp1 [Schizosaccharomyces cryophilus OY26]|uniref:GTP binding protein Gtp1 n=1 Tax=Schizosaccharomyces cryophilus (strain OY26 / ATCC MYA-4695 / CBS 11777 / NBRC 106824 / NRRL Y48691) TaxID=653667 RepID=S9VX32_SCHCR|nr:GTP binding protein Gtp1 [Schizosaccharomyces cryophilus OY26]EPY50530.1 GTP binding protein Gtp1 [Schizosaccharomyces cryophilus OY26]